MSPKPPDTMEKWRRHSPLPFTPARQAMMQEDNGEKKENRDPETHFEIGIRVEDAPGEDPAGNGKEPDTRIEGTAIHKGLDSPDPDEDPVLSEIRQVRDRLTQLHESFEDKLKFDAHKNKVIDTLHRELQEYRQGVIQKHLHSLITDTIKIIDDIRKFKAHYEQQPPSEHTAEKLLAFLDEIAADLEELFSWQGVIPFTCDQAHYDNTRQRVVKKIETSDPAMDKTVAESMRPGYEWNGKMLRPELVAVYVYNDASTEKGDTP